MKTIKLGTLAVVALGAAFAGAQTSGPSGFSARIGAAINNNSTFFSFGGDYKITQAAVNPTPNGYNTYLGISADFYGRDSEYVVPIALTYNVRANQALFLAGVGVDLSSVNSNFRTGLGFQVGAQYDFSVNNGNPIYASAKYFFTNENNLRALQLSVGYRF